MKRRNRSAWKDLLNLLRTGSDFERVEAAKAIARCRSRRGNDAVAALLREYDSPRASELAAYALMQIDSCRFVPALAACVRDKRQHDAVRGQAAEALGQTSFPSGSAGRSIMRMAESALLEALADASPTVRFWCCFGLGRLHSERAIAPLTHLRDHDSELAPGWWYVREEAADALEIIAGRPGEERMAVHLRQENVG